MSWLFSQALAEEYSAGSFTDAEPCAQLNVTLTPHKFWRNDKTMEFSKLSQFGLTLRLLTADRGEELLTSYLAAFPARTSAQLEPAQALTESEVDSGPTWFGLFARYIHVESKWKTAQCSLLGDSEEFSETWPRWGSMRNGVSYLRPTPELHICGSESGLWQTPVADDAIERKDGKWNSRGEPKLSAEVKLWPTPTASLGTKGGRITPRKGREGGTLIEAVSARRWPTPMANDSQKRGAARVGACLPGAVEQSNESGLLNPMWVEWLMGWPIGWTELKPLAMAKFHEWKQQHGNFLQHKEHR